MAPTHSSTRSLIELLRQCPAVPSQSANVLFISQVLGHNEHLYLKLPKGYRTWQSFLSIILIGQAVMIVVFPQTAWKLGIVGISGNSGSNSIATHYYAASLSALSFLLWKMNMNDKGVSRSIQTASLIHFAFLFVVDFLHGLLSEGIWSLFQTSVILMCALRLGIVGICLMYLKRMGTATSGFRRSPSYKDILESSTY